MTDGKIFTSEVSFGNLYSFLNNRCTTCICRLTCDGQTDKCRNIITLAYVRSNTKHYQYDTVMAVSQLMRGIYQMTSKISYRSVSNLIIDNTSLGGRETLGLAPGCRNGDLVSHGHVHCRRATATLWVSLWLSLG